MSAIFEGYVPRRNAKMTKRKNAAPNPEKPLDTLSKKRPRGRPRRVSPSEVSGRAQNYRGVLNQVWDQLWPLLEQAQTKEDVIRAFDERASPYAQEFMPALAGLVLEVMRDRRFPERREPQINFLADMSVLRFRLRDVTYVRNVSSHIPIRN
jgi:hypothetical protein